ncbi:MAG: hypothetical protein QM770_24260 [Tepidisphaeraceae bacterium]
MQALPTTSVEATPRPGPGGTNPTARRYRGEVVFMYAFDIAYELKRYPHAELMGQPVAVFSVDASKRSPKQLFFYRPQMVRMPPTEKFGADGALLRYQWTAKLLPVGAISLTVRIPFEVDALEDLSRYHDFYFQDGKNIHDEARAVAEQLRQALMPYLVRPRPGLSDEEAYTVFCMHTPTSAALDEPEFDSERWLTRHRRGVAAALTEEPEPEQLSEQECQESTNNNFTYSRRDLVVFDWDAALVVDEPNQFDQTLYVIELANVQLTELEAYDRILDEVIDSAYADLNSGKFSRIGGRRTQRELRVIRVDLARLTDELSNITKFFGDFHAGRLYTGLATRFHLPDWRRTIDHKLETLDDIYSLLATDNTNRWMLILETTIVFLILFEIIKTFVDPLMK